MRPLPQPLVEQIERRLRQRRVHGLALVAFDRDGPRFGGGVGFADLARGERATTDTVFRVASVSKQLTTAVVLKAVGAGLLDLDELVNDRLPAGQRIVDADDRPATIPLRTLLSHSSGLPSSIRGADLGNPVLTRIANGVTPTSLAEAVTGLRVERRAGERIIYANSGLNVAGHLAALAFDRSFETAAREQVLAPLGMERSVFSTRRQGPGIATPYGSIAPPAVSSKPATAMQLIATPMGGLTSTAQELSRFGRMILGGGVLEGEQILPEDLVRAATTLEITNHPDLEQGYGLGFKVRQWRGRRLVGHDGNMPGVAAKVWLAPEDGVGVVVLTNGFALGIPHEVALLALDELLGPAPAGDPGADPTPAEVREHEAFGRRVEGRYQVDGTAPPGIVGTLARLTTKVRIVHEARGLLRVEDNPGSDGPMWLRPDGAPGRYRVAAAVDHGTNAIFDERPDGLHLWISQGTLLRPA
ncbi:MAG: Penicillin-binding protein beta-lactamase class [Ilumatobacteraceae bacterium]|nr:Penicillin-binding protein beta-lactamase class [Ilumatobacteraceae bacterium]